MKLRIIKDGPRYKCQYRKYLIWHNFKDKRLNNDSNLDVWFGSFIGAELWMMEYIGLFYDKSKTKYLLRKYDVSI